VSPGDSATAFLVLEPGSYALICWMVDSAGIPHAMRGMISAVTVTGTTAGAPVEPRPDVLIREARYHIDVSPVLEPGSHVIRVDNDGPQEHDIQIVRVLPGKTIPQVLDWLDDPAKRVPAAEAIGGLSGVQRWGHGEFNVVLAPGEYAVVCWMPDDTDGRAHFRHGMMPASGPASVDTRAGWVRRCPPVGDAESPCSSRSRAIWLTHTASPSRMTLPPLTM
jgi:hypothetical protein